MSGKLEDETFKLETFHHSRSIQQSLYETFAFRRSADRTNFPELNLAQNKRLRRLGVTLNKLVPPKLSKKKLHLAGLMKHYEHFALDNCSTSSQFSQRNSRFSVFFSCKTFVSELSGSQKRF